MNLSSPIESLIPGLRGRVLTVLVRSPLPVGLRELSRRARTTSHSSVKRVLTELLDEGLVEYALVSRGGQYIQLNRSHILAEHLVAIDRANDDVLATIRTTAATWPRQPRAIVLFGSVARGDDTSNSDVDILMVWKDEVPPTDQWENERRHLTDIVYAMTGNTVNVTEFTRTQWEAAVARRDPFVASVEHDGALIVGTSVRALTQQSRNAVS
jgi:predicted nucleotidyltransferase